MTGAKEFSGQLLDETDDMMLVENNDDTATWHAKILIDNLKRTPEGVVTFSGEYCAVRTVNLM